MTTQLSRTDIPLPPERMPIVRAGRLLKRWRWVGVFGEELMLCVGDVHVGPARQTWWAIWDRTERRLLERTRRLRHSHVALDPGTVQVRDGSVLVDIGVEEEGGVETVCADGPAYTWTRKQADVAAQGWLAVDGRRREVLARAVVDESAGYHARSTSWRWSAGAGMTGDGHRLGWNLVEGINDPPTGSERSLWIDGMAHEVGPVSFDPGLQSIRFSEGGELRFGAEAQRTRTDNLLLIRSDYRQPFGTFTGTFPGGVELAHGLGVMEAHSARW